MKWLIATAAVLLAVPSVHADIPVPIPKGFKEVPFKYRIATEQDFSDYSFYTVEVSELPAASTRTAAPVKLDPKNPLSLTPTSHASFSKRYELFAIPKDAGKKYASEKELLKAIVGWSVPGQVRAKTIFAGESTTQIKESDPRKEVVAEHKIEKIDPKLGIVLTSPKSATPAKGEPGKIGSEECDDPDEPAPIAYTPKGGTWVAGLAAACAFVFGGLWIARRGRRELA